MSEVHLDLAPLEELKKGANRAIKVGINRAGKPVRLAVIGNAQRVARYGFLAKSIKSKSKVYDKTRHVLVIGPSMRYTRQKGKYKKGKRAGESKKHIPYLYSWLVERGTHRSRAKPFIKPAYQQHGQRYLDNVAGEIRKEALAMLAKRKPR